MTVINHGNVTGVDIKALKDNLTIITTTVFQNVIRGLAKELKENDIHFARKYIREVSNEQTKKLSVNKKTSTESV